RGAIIIVMQRLHVDDLVAHVQKHESWDVLSFPATAVKDEMYDVLTPYGRRRIHGKTDEILQPTLLSATRLADLQRGMTDYNFAGPVSTGSTAVLRKHRETKLVEVLWTR